LAANTLGLFGVAGALKYNNQAFGPDQTYEVVRQLQAVAGLLLWCKLLYFFRGFQRTGFYIRVLGEVSVHNHGFTTSPRD
jgi:hypothetical protein